MYIIWMRGLPFEDPGLDLRHDHMETNKVCLSHNLCAGDMGSSMGRYKLFLARLTTQDMYSLSSMDPAQYISEEFSGTMGKS